MRELATEFVEGRQSNQEQAKLLARLDSFEESLKSIHLALEPALATTTQPCVHQLIRRDLANFVKLMLLNSKLIASADFDEAQINDLLDKTFTEQR